VASSNAILPAVCLSSSSGDPAWKKCMWIISVGGWDTAHMPTVNNYCPSSWPLYTSCIPFWALILLIYSQAFSFTSQELTYHVVSGDLNLFLTCCTSVSIDLSYGIQIWALVIPVRQVTGSGNRHIRPLLRFLLIRHLWSQCQMNSKETSACPTAIPKTSRPSMRPSGDLESWL